MDWHSFNWIDYTICAVVIISTLISFVRGFVREALSLIVWIAALWIAYRFSGLFAEHFLSGVENASFRMPLAFLIVFFAILIVGAVVSYVVGRLVHTTGLTGTDRILGLVFGVARGVLLVAVLVLAANLTDIPKNQWWTSSQLIPQFEGIVSWLRHFLPKELDKLSVSNLSGNSFTPTTGNRIVVMPSASIN